MSSTLCYLLPSVSAMTAKAPKRVCMHAAPTGHRSCSQAATQLQQLRNELVDPWFAPAPPPLMDTSDPSLLGDADSRFIDVAGVRMHYKEYSGDASQPALLLLHGFNGSTFNWCAHLQAATTRRCTQNTPAPSNAGCRAGQCSAGLEG